MARKRGGIAGFYDRNKKAIKTIAPIAAGFIPGVGPLVGAALGAAMGGDTEGKGYFKGFNTGGALAGGVSGYGGAKLGQAAKGGLGNMFTGGMSPVDKLTGAPKLGVMTESLGPKALMGAPKLGVMTQTTGPAQAAFSTASNVASNAGNSSGFDSLGRLFGKEGLIEQNKTILSGIGRGVMGERAGARADEQAELQRIEDARQFDAGLAQRKAEGDFTGRRVTIEEAEEAERKRMAAATQANRDKYLAMFTGGAMA
jgi:hypothetical protein